MPKKYQNNKKELETDIGLLLKQIDISKVNAKKLLIKHDGDIMKCILESYDYQDKEEINPYLDRSEEDPQRILWDLRQMAAEKDQLFMEAMDKPRQNKKESSNKNKNKNKQSKQEKKDDVREIDLD